MTENYKLINEISSKDCETLVLKGKTYGDSWRRRGGVGAFMMLARKWDRIENICGGLHYDIFKAGAENRGAILDDIQDLRCYLLLVEAHVRDFMKVCGEAEPLAQGYVNQDICLHHWKADGEGHLRCLNCDKRISSVINARKP